MNIQYTVYYLPNIHHNWCEKSAEIKEILNSAGTFKQERNFGPLWYQKENILNTVPVLINKRETLVYRGTKKKPSNSR